MSWLLVVLWAITAIALTWAGICRFSTDYFNRQRHRIIVGLPEEPEPWYVRLFQKVNP